MLSVVVMMLREQSWLVVRCVVSPPLNAFILLILTVVTLETSSFPSILERLMSRQGLDPTDYVLMAFFLIDVICFCFEICDLMEIKV